MRSTVSKRMWKTRNKIFCVFYSVSWTKKKNIMFCIITRIMWLKQTHAHNQTSRKLCHKFKFKFIPNFIINMYRCECICRVIGIIIDTIFIVLLLFFFLSISGFVHFYFKLFNFVAPMKLKVTKFRFYFRHKKRPHTKISFLFFRLFICYQSFLSNDLFSAICSLLCQWLHYKLPVDKRKNKKKNTNNGINISSVSSIHFTFNPKCYGKIVKNKNGFCFAVTTQMKLEKKWWETESFCVTQSYPDGVEQ